MEVSTSNFGLLNIEKDEKIIFLDGLVGLPELNEFILIEDQVSGIFMWLQSTKDPSVCFPLIESAVFNGLVDYSIPEKETEKLRVEPNDLVNTFLLVTITEDIKNITVNFKAPIVINDTQRVGKQVVLSKSNLNVDEPAFVHLKSIFNQFSLYDNPESEQ